MKTCLAIFAATVAATTRALAAPTLAEVERYQLETGAPEARWLRQQDLSDPPAAAERIERERDARAKGTSYTPMQDNLRVCIRAAQFARLHHDQPLLHAAATLADAILRRHVTPSGAFVQVSRATWLTPATVWRTIPWGVPFNGNAAFEAWTLLKDEFTPDQRVYWQTELEKTGRWIHHNPVVGGYVFNAVMDICRLHWRLGQAFNHPEWSAWALEAAEFRIRRDLDEEGWIQGENGGASGGYQLFGSHFVALFAWETKAPFLIEAVKRIAARCYAPYATSTMDWAGNFGTRTSRIGRLPQDFLLVAAAFGDPSAAYFVQTYAKPDWPGELALWQAALAQPAAAAPAYAAVTTFKGIASTVVREGPWIAYFGNYDRSLWAHGFADLWHAGHGDWVFSTLQSLPKANKSEKLKLGVGDTSDWAGFPHVRVTAGDTHYDSHQRIDSLETTRGDGVTVTWTEPLLNPAGEPGGSLRSTYRFHGAAIDLQLELRDLAGESRLDFRLLKRPDGFSRLWSGPEVEDIFAGRMLRAEAAYGMDDRVFPAGKEARFAVQVDRTIFGFEVLAVPATATLTLKSEIETGLHTGNLGGFGFQIAVPAAEKNYTVKLRLHATE